MTPPTQQDNPIDLEALRNAAMSATPGPWHWSENMGASDDKMAEMRNAEGVLIFDFGDDAPYDALAGTEPDSDDVAFLEMWNPATALALLVLVDAQQKQIADQPGWISVGDRLPPNYEEVMVWPNPTDYIMTAEIYGTSASGNPVWQYGEYQPGWGHETVEITRPVTHWMLLPPPPVQP